MKSELTQGRGCEMIVDRCCVEWRRHGAAEEAEKRQEGCSGKLSKVLMRPLNSRVKPLSILRGECSMNNTTGVSAQKIGRLSVALHLQVKYLCLWTLNVDFP